MDLDAELMMLAGEDEDAGSPAKPSSPAASSPPSSPARSETTAKKRTRAPSARRSAPRKKARRGSDTSEGSNGLSSPESGEASESEPDGPGAVDYESSEDGFDEVNEFPLEGKYRSLADKQWLESLSQLDRETELDDRAKKIEEETISRALQKRAKQDKREKANGSTRKSERVKSTPGKSSAQAETRAKLIDMRNAREERKKRADAGGKGGDDERERHRASAMDDDSDEDKAAFLDEEPKEEREITREDINRARFGRTAFTKLCDYPGFEDAAQDCFVRIALFDKEKQTNTHRVAQIIGFKSGKPYNLLEGNRRTDRYPIVAHGNAQRHFPMDICSDSPFTEAEFARYKKTLELEQHALPTLSLVRRKATEMRELANKRLSQGELAAMIKKRKAGQVDTVDLVLRRGRLRSQRDQALEDGNEARARELEAEIQELEDQQNPPTARPESQMERIARLNHENRRRNIEEVRRAERDEKRRAREEQRRVEKEGGLANPFMRVKTVAKFRHDTPEERAKKNGGTTKENGEKKEENGVGVIAGTAVAGKPEKRVKRGGVDDVIASLDVGIEIEI